VMFPFLLALIICKMTFVDDMKELVGGFNPATSSS
jgi:hypothetical protein